MDLALVYPTKELTAVKIGGLPTKVIKLLSNQDLISSGEILYEMLALVCHGSTPAQFKDISLVDANRIMLTAWKNTHRNDRYIATVPCPNECGRTNRIVHDIDITYEKPDIYDEPVELETQDMETLETVKVKVQLRPMPLSLYETVIKASASNQVADMTQTMVWCRIASVDGKEDFDTDNMSMCLYSDLTDIVDSDTQATLRMFEKETVCVKCGHEFTNSVFWLDAGFLKGK